MQNKLKPASEIYNLLDFVEKRYKIDNIVKYYLMERFLIDNILDNLGGPYEKTKP